MWMWMWGVEDGVEGWRGEGGLALNLTVSKTVVRAKAKIYYYKK
jgi:hypothetical protein